MSEGSAWRARIAAPTLAVFAVLCCLAAPLIVGATGALAAGALFGIGAGAVVLLVLCLWVARQLTQSEES